MRTAALALAVSLVFLPMATRAAPLGPSRQDALVALCRLWNAIRFLHPSLRNESDGRWDEALLAVEPLIERDPQALRDAASRMLATLHDPLTTVVADGPAGTSAEPIAESSGGVRIVRIRGYPNEGTAGTYQTALALALKVPPTDAALIVDLRTQAPPTKNQFDLIESIWSQTGLVTHVSRTPIPAAQPAERYFLGFPSETDPSTFDYREGRETLRSSGPSSPAGDARDLPVAFITNATGVVPGAALRLERVGRAAIISEDGSPGWLPGETLAFDAGSGLKVVLRKSGPLEKPAIQTGGLDAALAWVRAPRPATEPDAALDISIQARYDDPALPQEPERVLAAFRMWGAIQYLSPYKSLMRDDWDAALREALEELPSVSTSLAYELVLAKMYSHLHDTHGFLQGPAMRSAYDGMPAFLARQVEGKPTIVRVNPLTARRDRVSVGDVVESIDGEPVAPRYARLRVFFDASTEQSAREWLDSAGGVPSLFAGSVGSTLQLGLRGADGRLRIVDTPRIGPLALTRRTRPAVAILPGRIGYIDLQRLKPQDVEAALARLAGAKAFIFDLRGYPRGTVDAIAPHFATHTVRAAYFRTPIFRANVSSDDSGLEFLPQTRDFFQSISPTQPHYTQPVVVVIDARAISQSEHAALLLAAAAHARFVGEATAGADGDQTDFCLPGGIAASFSGEAVLHADGTQLQRVGIVPDVPASQSLRGVRAGWDELLEAGLSEALRLAHAGKGATAAALAEERSLERADALAQREPPPSPQLAPADAPALPESSFEEFGRGYEAAHDVHVHHRDARTIVLMRVVDSPASPFGAYTESIPIGAYRGKRVRVSGYLRTVSAGAASFFLRVNDANGVAAFDNMADRPVHGTSDWTPFAIVLDVSPTATELAGGLLLQGAGTVWADDLRIDMVGPSIPVTGS
jgi:C-terminal processing protease CtpA/Prc